MGAVARPVSKPKVTPFSYDNFHEFMKDRVNELKSIRKGFTMRALAERVGFGSPSFLKMVMDGERTLTENKIEAFCDILELEDKEKDYFVHLVLFNQSHNPDTKNEHRKELEKLRPRVTFSKLEQNQQKYLSHDYYACIREMVLLKNFKEDAKWIAKNCLPKIKPAEARDALETLLELGLLKRNEKGLLEQADPIVDTGSQANSLESFAFHEAVLNKARRYLTLLEQNKRSFAALTIPIPERLEKDIMKRMEDFQNDILNLINQEGLDYDRVYQLNLQFFPVSQKTGDDQ